MLWTEYADRKGGREAVETVKKFIKANDGKLAQVIEFGTGNRVEIPINSDGHVRWYEDRVKAELMKST